ncbi:MAG: hypothetical protein JEZ05_00355 [Tenericutes bacterium]|nr:hypothetical protein [Mycoplasmatota bacterium]
MNEWMISFITAVIVIVLREVLERLNSHYKAKREFLKENFNDIKNIYLSIDKLIMNYQYTNNDILNLSMLEFVFEELKSFMEQAYDIVNLVRLYIPKIDNQSKGMELANELYTQLIVESQKLHNSLSNDEKKRQEDIYNIINKKYDIEIRTNVIKYVLKPLKEDLIKYLHK